MYGAVLLHPLLQQLGVFICPEGVKGSHILATLVWHLHMSWVAVWLLRLVSILKWKKEL
jgi:hypothetical protein